MALDVAAVHVDGDWIRHAPHNSDLLGRAVVPSDGRWQHGAAPAGLYLADDADTATAEWYRLLAEYGIPPARRIPHDRHIWRLDLSIADLSDSARLARVGLAPPTPGRRTWPPYQDVGETLWREGWAGLLAPSAARPRGLVACLFAATWPPSGCAPARVLTVSEVPAPPRGMTT